MSSFENLSSITEGVGSSVTSGSVGVGSSVGSAVGSAVGSSVGSAVSSAVGVTSFVGSAVAVGSGVAVASGVGVPVSMILFQSNSPFLLHAASTKVNTKRHITNSNLAFFMSLSP